MNFHPKSTRLQCYSLSFTLVIHFLIKTLAHLTPFTQKLRWEYMTSTLCVTHRVRWRNDPLTLCNPTTPRDPKHHTQKRDLNITLFARKVGQTC